MASTVEWEFKNGSPGSVGSRYPILRRFAPVSSDEPAALHSTRTQHVRHPVYYFKRLVLEYWERPHLVHVAVHIAVLVQAAGVVVREEEERSLCKGCDSHSIYTANKQ